MALAQEEVVAKLSTKDDMSPALGKARGAVKSLKSDLEGLSGSSRGMDNLTRSTLNWRGAIGHVQGQMAGFNAGLNRMIGRAAIGFGALAGGAATWGLKSAASFELSKSALGALLGGVDKGNAMFAEMQQYNLAAPFDFQGITQAGQVLLQFGVAGDKMMPVLKGLGDIASMTGSPTENLRSMALAMGQISGAGVMRAQDMNQLVQAGFPAYALLSEISGKTSAQLRKDMEVGLTLPADQFIDAVANMQGATLEIYKGGAQKQNNTLWGQWANFKDRLSLSLAAGLEPAIPEIKAELPKLADSLADAIRKMAPELPKFVDAMVTLAPVIVDLTGAFAGLVTEVAPMVKATADLLGPTGVKVLLGVLLGYSALTKAASAVRTFSGALAILRGVEAGAGVGAGAGMIGVPGKGRRGLMRRIPKGKAALGVAALGTTAYYAHKDQSVASDVGTVGSAAITGATIASVVPGVGTGVGAAVGAGVGAAAVLDKRLSGTKAEQEARLNEYLRKSGREPYDANINVGQINVHNPSSNVDVQRAVADGLKQHARERRARE